MKSNNSTLTPKETTCVTGDRRRPNSHMAIGQHNFAVRISDTLAEQFIAACRERGSNMTLVIKQLMSDFIES